ncbi:MAG: replication initiation protein [Terracidiphilus sp.]
MGKLTVQQITNQSGFPKPAELIEISGAHALEASDRAIMNLLYQHAHDCGGLSDPLAQWEILIAELRLSGHKGKGRILDSLDRLMSVVVTVPLPDSKTGEPRILKTHLLDFVNISADEARRGGTVRYGIPRMLQPYLAASNRWGRIKAEVVCSMTSKYAIALYEMVQLRANMQRCTETFQIDRFRELLGVPPGAYDRGNDFQRYVINAAALEINGLSDCTVEISLVRSNKISPITAVTLSWWRKGGPALQRVLEEREKSKFGRAVRLLKAARDKRTSQAQPASRAAAILAELDARGAEDTEYRAGFSTGSKTPLRKGQTWRGRLVAHIEKERAFAAAGGLPE